MPIKVLPTQVVSKIAAGEVVERPASVVKELLENALDSGATTIDIETRSGGINFIKVIDNGCGIPAAEVELAFRRHATSKIDKLEDLEKLATLGFRGEALPSIATVSDVEVLTQTKGEEYGSYLRLIGGSVNFREKRSRAVGASITVHNLFRHFPARLKFLKSVTTENSHIANLVTQYALAFPEVKFSYSVEGRQSLNTWGNGKLLDAVAAVYGVEVAGQMLAVSHAETGCSVAGLVSPPSLNRSSRNYLSFFINRRWVHSALLTRAAEDAYAHLLMTGRHPIVILNLTLPTQDIDVNVHPSKIEVKFRNNPLVYTAVEKAVKKALEAAPVPQFKDALKLSPVPTTAGLWEKVELETGSVTRAQASVADDTGQERHSLPVLRVLGQLASSYILAEGPEGLYMIDQHAAHERIQFEKVLRQKAENKGEIQGLLEPLHIEFSPKQVEVLEARAELLQQYGFTLEPFGGRSYLLRAVPAMVSQSNLDQAIREMVDALAMEKDMEKSREKLMQNIACHGAVKAGQVLSMEEMRELIKALEETDNPRTCPHGRPTVIHLSSRQLEKEFGRIR